MWLRKAIEPGMAERGIDVVASARNLGVTQRGAGKLSSRAPNARKKRDEAVKARKSKIAFAKRHGGKVAIVARRGLVPSKQYGARVVGTPPTELESMRKLVASALPGRHFGRSRTLRLATFGAETLRRLWLRCRSPFGLRQFGTNPPTRNECRQRGESSNAGLRESPIGKRSLDQPVRASCSARVSGGHGQPGTHSLRGRVCTSTCARSAHLT
jgi:hypothetical protein